MGQCVGVGGCARTCAVMGESLCISAHVQVNITNGGHKLVLNVLVPPLMVFWQNKQAGTKLWLVDVVGLLLTYLLTIIGE